MLGLLGCFDFEQYKRSKTLGRRDELMFENNEKPVDTSQSKDTQSR